MKTAWKIFLAAAGISAVLDLASKWAVERFIAPYTRVVLVDGFFHLTNVRNPGAAFGLFDKGGFGRIAFFLAVGVVAMGFILWLMRRCRDEDRLEALSLGLVFGGALGNFVDRVRYGEVVDFLLFFWRDFYYPAFNVADIAVCVGIFLFIITDLGKKREA